MDNQQFEYNRKFWGSVAIKGNLMWPNESVIRFVKKNYPIAEHTSYILDYGCGGGRDSFALCTMGYRMIAMDYADEALDICRTRCARIDKEYIRIVKNMGLEVPLEDECVDAVVADGSLFYYPKTDIIRIVSELRRVLRRGGLLWASFRTREDSMYGTGTFLDDGLYVLDDNSGRDGCTYYFAGESDIKDISSEAGLTLEAIDDVKESFDGRKKLNCWFHVLARK